MRTIQVYQTYSFTKKDPAIDRLRTAIQDQLGSTNQKVLKRIHEASNVSIAAMNGWFGGKTRRPQYATMAAVAGAIGGRFDLILDGESVVNNIVQFPTKSGARRRPKKKVIASAKRKAKKKA